MRRAISAITPAGYPYAVRNTKYSLACACCSLSTGAAIHNRALLCKNVSLAVFTSTTGVIQHKSYNLATRGILARASPTIAWLAPIRSQCALRQSWRQRVDDAGKPKSWSRHCWRRVVAFAESRAQGVQGVVRVFEVHVHQILGAQCCVSGGEGMRNSKDAKLLDNWFFTLSTTMMLPAVMCLVEGYVLGRYTRSGTQVQLRSAIA